MMGSNGLSRHSPHSSVFDNPYRVKYGGFFCRWFSNNSEVKKQFIEENVKKQQQKPAHFNPIETDLNCFK